jgi:hypothetical protein
MAVGRCSKILDDPGAEAGHLRANLGGRPTDRDLLLEEAGWRLRHPETLPPTLAAFAGELRNWLEVHGVHRAKKTGEVMKAETIEGHVRSLWNRYRQNR